MCAFARDNSHCFFFKKVVRPGSNEAYSQVVRLSRMGILLGIPCLFGEILEQTETMNFGVEANGSFELNFQNEQRVNPINCLALIFTVQVETQYRPNMHKK